MTPSFWKPFLQNSFSLLGVTVLCALFPNISSATNVSGAISTNTTWTLSGSPYIVTGDVTVGSAATLNIDSGVQVKFNAYYSIVVNGTLKAMGQPGNLILFTTNKATPLISSWGRIVFSKPNDTSSVIQYSKIEYSFKGIECQTSSPTIQNDLIQNNATGIYLQNANVSSILNNTIINNVYGLQLTGSSDNYPVPIINNNSIYSNSSLNLWLSTSGNTGSLSNLTINAEKNWWGTTSITQLEAAITDQVDNPSYPLADVSPYLDGPAGNQVSVNVVGGQLVGNTTWGPAQNPLIVVSNIIVPSGVTLTISPGTIIKFDGNYSVTVNGILKAAGEADNGILLTSNKAAPTLRDWNGIIFADSSDDTQTVMKYCTIEYAATAISTNSASPKIQKSVIRKNNVAIDIANSNSSNLTSNVITNNNIGIQIRGTGAITPTITNNSFLSNGSNSIYIQTSASAVNSINAEYNWWGTTDVQQIENTIVHQKDFPSLSFVDYIPYLTQPPTSDNFITIGNVSLSSIFFNPRKAETISLRYNLDKPANTTLKITNDTNQTIRTIVNNQPRGVGANSEIWDGRDDANQIVPTGLYKFTITAMDSAGGSGLYDPVFTSGIVQLMNGSLTPVFNPFVGEVSQLTYNLYAPAKVTLKVGGGNATQPTRSVVSGVYRDKGTNTELWDGRDDSGNMAPSGDYFTYAYTEVLAENAIVVRDSQLLSVSNLHANPFALYPIFGEITNVEYTLPQNSLVTLKIANSSGTVLRNLLVAQNQSSGFHSMGWDMKDDAGKLISLAGDYKILMILTSLDGTESLTRYGNIRLLR